ncbi:DUF3717 domain-containing protein [Burkholderia aenigmatica]|uniref:DUF3717 domain-containing protein n=1 Tax=Burkholderia aenigmatica TaxID=2015348 RepID=UPI002653805E|nr:DUF3717 domain-containing protein [Burkholderia aenigmatica]MDN7880101.1 DUF3717 domain-containing protein [Burkholderia aenigmatica]
MSTHHTERRAYTITEIEQSINFWRSRDHAADDAALRGPARSLADVYGLMIYEGAEAIDVAKLKPDQRESLDKALAALYPSVG